MGQIQRTWGYVSGAPSSYIAQVVDESNRIDLAEREHTDNELGMQWMINFEEATRPSNPEDWRLLAVDSHGSHTTIVILNYAYNHQIEVVGYPPLHASAPGT